MKPNVTHFQNRTPSELLEENRELIYSVTLYLCGLLLGAFLYRTLDAETKDKVIVLLTVTKTAFQPVFLRYFAILASVFLLCVLFSFSLFGFPFLQLMPLFAGMLYGFIIFHYYQATQWKGLGYSALTVAPKAATVALLLCFTVRYCARTSKSVFLHTMKKTEIAEPIHAPRLLKSYLLLFLCTAAAALINTALTLSLGQLLMPG